MGFFRIKYLCGSLFALLLTLFTVFVLLDAFVIPRKLKAETDNPVISDKPVITDPVTEPASEPEQAENDTSVQDKPEVTQETDTPTEEASAVAGWVEPGVVYPVITDNSYIDENIYIKLDSFTENDTVIYTAEVRITDISYLKAAFAQGQYGRNITEKTSDTAAANNAIFAVNGDYYGFRNYGFVLRNGVLYRTSSYDNEVMVINGDGSVFSVFEATADAQALADNGAWQIFSFGPAIIEDGVISITEKTEVETASRSNPRTAIGVLGELHYLFVTSDGRTDDSKGLKLYELAQVMEALGCTYAYNLDGGGSTTMWFNGRVVNVPTNGRTMGERRVSDIVYIGR